MYIDGVDEYKEIILEKLKFIERKLELASIGVTDNQKLIDSSRNLSQIRADMARLKHGELTWNDLKIYNITQTQMVKIEENRQYQEENDREGLQDFNSLCEVPIKDFGANIPMVINELYSIVEFINQNYLALFTQKILLYSTRNSTARENIYQHYQELVRLFTQYIDFANSSSAHHGNTHQESVLQKEYTAIFKKYYTFINSVRGCIDAIMKDETFTDTDFNVTISSVDPNMRIYGLTFKVALAECRNFINEIEEYMAIINKEFFDIVNIDNKKSN